LGAMSRARGHKTSAAVNIHVDEDDKLPVDFVEGKEPEEQILYSIFNEEPDDNAIYTFVENLKTGKFSKIFDNQLVIANKKATDYTPISQLSVEKKVYLRLESWLKRLHRIFILAEGLLAGMALLHIYLVFWSNDNEEFIPVYARLSRVIAGMFHILVMISLIGSIHTLMSEYRHYKHISSTVVDYDTEKHRLPYYVAWFCSICYSICMIITIFNAMFVNKMYYEDQRDPTFSQSIDGQFSSEMSTWAFLCVLRALLIIVVWIVINSQTYWNVGTMYAMKIEEIERRALLEDLGSDVYRHLFYGNPYLPNGLF
jgi:hypothetical protein